MINLKDKIAQAHNKCDSIVLKWWRKDQLRCYCEHHKKWLHTLTRQETKLLENEYESKC